MDTSDHTDAEPEQRPLPRTGSHAGDAGLQFKALENEGHDRALEPLKKEGREREGEATPRTSYLPLGRPGCPFIDVHEKQAQPMVKNPGVGGESITHSIPPGLTGPNPGVQSVQSGRGGAGSLAWGWVAGVLVRSQCLDASEDSLPRGEFSMKKAPPHHSNSTSKKTKSLHIKRYYTFEIAFQENTV